jgi:hypothetical protein
VSAVFLAGEKAKVKDRDGFAVSLPTPIWLGAIASEAELYEGEHRYSYVFASGSEALIRNEALGDPSLGNGDVMFSLLRTISRTDVFASGEIGGFDMNQNYGGKMFDETHLSDGEENEVWFGLDYYRMYKGLTVAHKVFLYTVTLAVPAAFVLFTAFYVLRRRQDPVLTVAKPKGKEKKNG